MATYRLMDSKFTMPDTISSLADQLPVIGRVRKIKTVITASQVSLWSLCPYMGVWRSSSAGENPASGQMVSGQRAALQSGVRAAICNGDWLAILSADNRLPDEDIIRECGKHWDMEAFFDWV